MAGRSIFFVKEFRFFACGGLKSARGGKNEREKGWLYMKLRYRITLCAMLLLTAGLCASYTVRDLRGGSDARLPETVPAAVSEPPDGFTLCARNGCVAVLDPGCETAVVTDIELSTLREADRQLLEAGLTVTSREELLTLLEDLGS